MTMVPVGSQRILHKIVKQSFCSLVAGAFDLTGRKQCQKNELSRYAKTTEKHYLCIRYEIRF